MSYRSRIMTGLVAGALLVSVAGPVAAQSAAPTGGLANTEWLLSSVGSTPVASGIGADILFADEDAGGFAGCNRFFASYTTDGASSLSFGPVGSTMMACDDATNAFEQSYLTALGQVASYAIGADGTLTMSDASGAAVLTYGPGVPATVEGPWNITMVNNGKGGVESLPAGISASISFHPDGTVEGFGGCNSFSGGYGVQGDTITIGPLMSTMMSCGDATDTFEVQLLTALQAATTWSVTSGTLDLRDGSGAQQVEATSALGR